MLHVPVAGDAQERAAQASGNGPSVDLPVNVSGIEHEKNDHNRADELRMTIDWLNVGLDVRLIRNATADFYLGQADDFGNWTPSRRDLRFCGVVAGPELHTGEGQPRELELRLLDYTDFFLRIRQFGSSGIPDLSQTLDDAWRRIVSQTPGAAVLADRLLWVGDNPSRRQELRDVLNGKQRSLQNAPFPRIGDAVSERFRKLGKVPTKPKTDGWAVWQECVGMLGLLSWIDRDWVVIATSTNYYTETDPPVFSWGQNIGKLSEGSDPIFRRGVLLQSFDTLTGRTIEARFLPDEEKKIRRVSAHKSGARAEVLKEADWEVFAVPGITDHAILLTKAQRIYDERSRQELQGTLATGEMRVQTQSGADYDVLELGHGDDIRIDFNNNDRDALLELPDLFSRLNYLIDRGYASDVALILAKNVEAISLFKPIFHVKRVLTRIDLGEDPPTVDFEVTYTNKIQTDGDKYG